MGRQRRSGAATPD